MIQSTRIKAFLRFFHLGMIEQKMDKREQAGFCDLLRGLREIFSIAIPPRILNLFSSIIQNIPSIIGK